MFFSGGGSCLREAGSTSLSPQCPWCSLTILLPLFSCATGLSRSSTWSHSCCLFCCPIPVAMVEPNWECPGITMTGPLHASTQLAEPVKKVNRMLEIVSEGLKQTNDNSAWNGPLHWLVYGRAGSSGRVKRSYRVKCLAFASIIFRRQRWWRAMEEGASGIASRF